MCVCGHSEVDCEGGGEEEPWILNTGKDSRNSHLCDEMKSVIKADLFDICHNTQRQVSPLRWYHREFALTFCLTYCDSCHLRRVHQWLLVLIIFPFQALRTQSFFKQGSDDSLF